MSLIDFVIELVAKSITVGATYVIQEQSSVLLKLISGVTPEIQIKLLLLAFAYGAWTKVIVPNITSWLGKPKTTEFGEQKSIFELI